MFDGLFRNANDVFENFRVPDEKRADIHILYATYEYEDYSGAAGVIAIINGELRLIVGSHCSCYGLEDQWDPEPIDIDTIMFYANNNATPNGVNYNAVFRRIAEIVPSYSDISPTDLALILKLSF